MAVPLRVLLVEKDEEDLQLITQELERAGFEAEIHTVAIERDYFTQLESGHDVIISNYALMQFDALRALEILKEKGLDTPFIVVGGKVGEELAVECIKQGAADFLLKTRLSRLGQVVKRVLQEKKVQRETTQTQASLHEGARLYRQLLEFCPVGITLVKKGDITFVNRSGAHLLGAASPKQLLEKSLAGFAHADSQEDLEKKLQESEFESSKTTLLKEKFVRLDDKEIDLELEALLINDSGQQAILLVMHDISEKEQEQDLLPFHADLLSQVPDAVVAVDEKRKITYWNQSAEKLYGVASDQALGKKLDEVYEKRWLDEGDEKASGEALAKSGFWRGSNIHIAKSGKEIHVNSSVSLLKDEEGKSGGMISVVRDVTNTQQSEDSLRKERNFYSSVVNATAGLLLVYDKEGRILLFNGACEKLSGYSVNEVRRKHSWDFLLPPEDKESAQAIFKDLKVDQFPNSRQEHWITKDAARKLISWSDTALTDDKGDVACVVSAGVDITDEKKAEEGDRQSADYFRSLVENAADAFLVLDRDGVIRFENPSFAKMLGYKSEEFLEKNLRELVHPEDAPTLSKALEGVKKKPDSAPTMQLRLKSMEGPWVTVEGTSKNFLKDPVVSGIAVLLRDITRRKRTEQGLQRRLQTLDALHAIDIATSSGLDLQVTVKVILEQLTKELDVDAASVLLFHPNTHNLKYFSGLGFRNIDITHSEINLGEGVAGKAGLERELIRIPDLRDSEEASRRAELLAEEEFVAYYAMPLVARGELKGVLEIFNRSDLSPDQDWLDLLSAVASQAAVAMDNADLIAELQNHNTGLSFAYDATLEKVAYALDLREQLSTGHSQRLAEWTLKLGEAMGMEGSDLINDRRGALLHDIGKIGVPESVLLKPGLLSEGEWEVMRKHPQYAYLLLSEIPYLRSAVDIPYCHHEKFDGSGYPRGLKGKEIPLAARVFAVVEAWDVLGCDRPYREAWPNMKIRDHLKSQSGIDFDPEVVEKFLDMERDGSFTREPPVESILAQEETLAEQPQEEVLDKPEEKAAEEASQEEPVQEVAEEAEEPREEAAEEPGEEASPDESEEKELQAEETITPEEPKESPLKLEEASPEEQKDTGLKFKDDTGPEESSERDLKPDEQASPEVPKESALRFKEETGSEGPEGTGLKVKDQMSIVQPVTDLKIEEKTNSEEPKETNSEPPLTFTEPLPGAVAEELGEIDGGKVTDRLMGIVDQPADDSQDEAQLAEELLGGIAQEPLDTEEGKET